MQQNHRLMALFNSTHIIGNEGETLAALLARCANKVPTVGFTFSVEEWCPSDTADNPVKRLSSGLVKQHSIQGILVAWNKSERKDCVHK